MQTLFSQLHTIIDFSNVLAEFSVLKCLRFWINGRRLLFPTSNWHKRATKRLDVAKLRWVDASSLATIGDPLRHPGRCLSIALLQKPNEDQTRCPLQGAWDGMRQTSPWSIILKHRNFADLSMTKRVLRDHHCLACFLICHSNDLASSWFSLFSYKFGKFYFTRSGQVRLHYIHTLKLTKGATIPPSQGWFRTTAGLAAKSWSATLDICHWKDPSLALDIFSDSIVSKLRLFWDVKTQHRV